MAADLVDEFLLMFHPFVLGDGRRLFQDKLDVSLELIRSANTSTGVVIAVYEQAKGSA